jgi:hypothetical protein
LDFKIDRNSYNNLCLDINFWNEIDCEKLLIYQTDTFIFEKFDDEFLKYDYLGANWGPSKHSDSIRKKLNLNFDLHFGNGGLSLRSKEIIINSLSDKLFFNKYANANLGDVTLDKMPEDLFFSLYFFTWNFM